MPLRQRPDEPRPRVRPRSWRPDPRAMTALPLALIVLITVVVLAPSRVHLGPLLIVAPVTYEVQTFPFRPGDRLLIYTDGVIEARDAQRRFHPLTERVTAWQAERPADLLHHLRRDLLTHVGHRLDDDAAMVVVERLP
ncbi:SpoIIE family protein phosphatase [Kitasatospora sp. NPDC059648]|uniref:SpoIIE family protein phosphatase n=1 Tax=Kitasatospora sp. NPDC059648 TaxID=3346894 RepID=UPI0036CA07BF